MTTTTDTLTKVTTVASDILDGDAVFLNGSWVTATKVESFLSTREVEITTASGQFFVLPLDTRVAVLDRR